MKSSVFDMGLERKVRGVYEALGELSTSPSVLGPAWDHFRAMLTSGIAQTHPIENDNETQTR